MQKLKKEHLHKAETPARASGKDGNFSADDGKPERENMRVYRIKAANKKHFDSLIKDYRKDGFMIITYGYFLAELEKRDEFIIIEY